MRTKILITLLIFILIASTVNAQVSVTDNNIKITADKEQYYCEPVTSPDGCLIQSKITVENFNNFPINAFLEFDSNKDVRIRQFRNAGLQIATEKSRGKNLHSIIPYLISGNDKQHYDIEFYTLESGKFNFSVYYNGMRTILDPFFNTTFNNTNPTLHLESGRVTSYNDSEFIVITNLSNELNDGSDATRFETSRTQFTNNALLSFLYQGATSFFGEVQARGDGSNASNNLDGATRYYEANTASPLTNGDQMEIHFQDSIPPSASLNGVFITNTAQTITYAKFDSQAVATTYFLTLENINTTESSFRIWANASEDTGDKEIVDLVRVSETIEGQALRLSFPVNINTDNQYFLQIRKVTAGTEDIQVMHYKNNTDQVLEFVANDTFSAGLNNIELFPVRNDTASFRVFSAVIEEISEVQLIEIISDVIPPTILNFSASPLQLECNDIITFKINATDDNFIDNVLVTYNFSTSIITEEATFISGNTYRLTKEYDYLDADNGTYEFLTINVTDLSGLATGVNPGIQYNYFCNDTALLPPVPPQEAFSLATCPTDTIPRVLLFMFLFVIAFTMMALGWIFKNGMMGVFGALGMLFLSFYLWVCIPILALMLMAFSLMSGMWFAIRGSMGTL